mmetsp:Transcript_20487/g.18127  ORF Transcript_20487/g.18127 Transcript_20487/m.18127 type:complete len:268 (-) Transcript_20487:54-857(-)
MVQDEIDNKFLYDSSDNPTDQICRADDYVPKSSSCSLKQNTNEGVSAWKEAVTNMTPRTEISELIWSEGLAQACYDHVSTQGPNGGFGNTGEDGSTPFERMDRYTTGSSQEANIGYGNYKNGYDAVLQLIIDDGSSSRSHRDNILDSGLTHVGGSCGCHSLYTEVCCFAYGKDVVEIDSSMVADVSPQLSTCSAYSSSKNGDTTGLFDTSNNPPTVGTSLGLDTNGSGSGSDGDATSGTDTDGTGTSKSTIFGISMNFFLLALLLIQ